ncbi:metallophosphoesterase [soil metagenome]
MPEFVTVVQISDPHLRAVADPAQGSPDSGLRQLVELLASEQPEVVLLTGDVADDGSLAAYERAQYMVAGLGAAVLATPGNHDDPAALAEVFGRAKALEIGGWRLLCVNTFVPGEQFGKIDVDATLDLLGTDQSTPTALAMHHPPVTTSTHDWFRLDGGAELVSELVRRGDVRIVVSGHLHEAFNAVVGPVSFLGCSSSFYSLKHRNDEMLLDQGHVGGLRLRLYDNGAWNWRRLPDPNARSVAA